METEQCICRKDKKKAKLNCILQASFFYRYQEKPLSSRSNSKSQQKNVLEVLCCSQTNPNNRHSDPLTISLLPSSKHKKTTNLDGSFRIQECNSMS